MERYISIFILLISLYPLTCKGIDNGNSNQILRIEKGDIFVYKIQSKHSYFTKNPEGVRSSYNSRGEEKRILSIRTSESKLYFEVIEKKNDGCYIFKYKKEYSIYRSENNGITRSADSRFPNYGTRPEDVLQCYLNTVYYQVSFCASTGKLEILNLNQIKKEFFKYLVTREIPDDVQMKNAISVYLDEDRILTELEFLNYITNVGDAEKKNGEVVNLHLINTSDEHTSYKLVVENFNMRLNASFPDKNYSKIGTLTFDNNSGLLLKSEASSYLADEKIKTDKLYYKRTDIADYSESIKLDYYSARSDTTWICGKYKVPGVNKVGLSRKERIIGSETEYKEYQVNSTGHFAIPLEIREPKKYTLNFLKAFPSFTGKGDPELFVKPGDSIFISYDSIYKSFNFSGRGYKDSEVLNRIQLPGRLEYILHIGPLEHFIPSQQYYFIEKSIANTIQILKDEKKLISEEFYSYMLSEFNSAQAIVDYYNYWKTFTKEYLEGNKLTIDNKLLCLPDIPTYPDYSMLNQYDAFISTYTMLRYNIFNYFNTGVLPLSFEVRDLDFKKLLLSGVPYYINVGNMMEEIIAQDKNLPIRDFRNYYIDDFIDNCNNQESRDYINELIYRRKLISPGSTRPLVNLLDMNGNPYNWESTSGKVVVMMLFNDYSSLHFFSEDLFKEYGNNQKDVIILRISPGISFNKWKAFNERYSKLGHQMYYADGEHAFNKQFLTSFRMHSRFLVIDRQGKIFNNAGISNLKGAIKVALKQAPPPRTPFLETMIGRVLPGALLGMILSFFLYRFIISRKIKRYRLTQRMNELEQKALKAQLNPHFLFNSLNSIQHLIRSDMRKEADSYLSSFASLIRKILSNSEKESISISEEMDTLRLYIELEQMRFDFSCQIEIDPDIDIYNTMLPSMLLQPIVENAILHGLDPKKGERELNIEIQESGESLKFIIDDNGVGRGAPSNHSEDHDSRGLKMIESRIALLNNSIPGKYSIEIIDKKDAGGNPLGTRVIIIVPDEE